MLYIMLFFSLLAGIDKLFGNKKGLGEKFDQGFLAMGSLALTIIGIYSLSPIIAKLLVPILLPVSDFFNLDPSVFISSILAPDLGGFPTSISIAKNEKIGILNGVVLASSLGTIISFSIPVAFSMIKYDDFEPFTKGILAGVTTIPLGVFAAGIMLDINFISLLINLIPVILFSLLVTVGLLVFQEKTITIFRIIGKAVLFFSTTGLIIGIFQFSTGIVIFSDLISLEESFKIVLSIAVVLSGAYPMLLILSEKLKKPLKNLSIKFGLNEYSILGIISTLASCLPMLAIYDKFDRKGKILNAAFTVSGAFVF
ncbi:MAG: ethanolamine utilization protein EutH [Tissierellales bacterium]|nr:ethanolamine utilization protein EutH [Tissierellales bacterium]